MSRLKDAIQIYEYANDYGISEDILLDFVGMKQSEYKELLNLEPTIANTYDSDFVEEKNREFEEATFNEYFDWARTYRYALWR